MKKVWLAIGITMLLLFGYLVFGVTWKSYWVENKNCLEPVEVDIKDIFDRDITSRWSYNLPDSKIEKLHWEGPGKTGFLDEKHLDLSSKKIMGYLWGTYTPEQGVPVKTDTNVFFNGNVYVLKYNFLVSFLNQKKEAIFVIAEVNGEKLLIASRVMNGNILGMLENKSCEKLGD